MLIVYLWNCLELFNPIVANTSTALSIYTCVQQHLDESTTEEVVPPQHASSVACQAYTSTQSLKTGGTRGNRAVYKGTGILHEASPNLVTTCLSSLVLHVLRIHAPNNLHRGPLTTLTHPAYHAQHAGYIARPSCLTAT